jgi:hypothetical protein
MSCLQSYGKKISKFGDYPFCRTFGIRNITVAHTAAISLNCSTWAYSFNILTAGSLFSLCCSRENMHYAGVAEVDYVRIYVPKEKESKSK